jgi:hypothetical protein
MEGTRRNPALSRCSDTKSVLDICKIAVIVVGDERQHSLFDRPSKAARLRVGARVVAIVSDRFSTGADFLSFSQARDLAFAPMKIIRGL